MSKGITCIGCNKKPSQIMEYKMMTMSGEFKSAEEAMKAVDGTYNKFEENRFYCTTCYIKAGSPAVTYR